MARNKQTNPEVKLYQIDTMVYLTAKNIISKIEMFSKFLEWGGLNLANSIGLNKARALELFDKNYKISDIKDLDTSSQANETWLRKSGFLVSTDGRYELSPIAAAILEKRISIAEYCILILSKQWISIKKPAEASEYKSNLLAIILKILNAGAMPEKDFVSTINKAIVDTYVGEYEGLALSNKEAARFLTEPLLLSGLIEKSNDDYKLSDKHKELVDNYILHYEKIKTPDEVTCNEEEYLNSFKYGLYDIVNKDNEHIYSTIYPGLFKYKQVSSVNTGNLLPMQSIYYGAPGTGKSHTINKETKGHQTFRTTFHPDSDYSTFVGAYKPTMVKRPCYGLNGSRTIPLVVNGKQLEESKIEYRFVKQAFIKAYIAAWRALAEGSNVALTSQEPSPISLSYSTLTWTLTDVDDDRVLYTKEEKITVDEYKKNVINYWPIMPEPDEKTGKVKLGPFDHYQAAGCAWYRGGHGKDHSADECWEAIINVLKAGGTVEATPNSQTYSISLRGDQIIAITRDNKATRNTIKGCYENVDASTSVQKRIAQELKQFDDTNFDKAWEELKRRVNGMEIPESTNAAETPPVFLIIEEINRGNCAQIFGDIFQLLDRKEGFSQYPIHADEDIRKCLISEHTDEDPSFGIKGLELSNEQKRLINSVLDCKDDIAGKIAKGEVLVLPSNLYIWATMNTSDQSLFPIDSAFKRRWDWKYRPIVKGRDEYGNELNWRIAADTKEYDWWSFLEKINIVIGSVTNSEDKKLGFFFCKAIDGVISAETFVSKVIFYLWNDVFKNFGFDDDIFNDEKSPDGSYSTLEFDKFYTTSADGETIVRKAKVEKFLENLKVEEVIIEDTKSAGGFSLDGESGMSLGAIAKEVVQRYAINNPTKSAQEIRDIFVEQCKGIGAAHIVETEEEYHKRDGQPSQARSASEITIPTGEKLYVTTQWRAKNDNDNFIKFIDVASQNNWGTITQEKYEVQ